MNDGYAIENCESLAKWESDVHGMLLAALGFSS